MQHSAKKADFPLFKKCVCVDMHLVIAGCHLIYLLCTQKWLICLQTSGKLPEIHFPFFVGPVYPSKVSPELANSEIQIYTEGNLKV